MSRTVKSALDLVGNTPLLEVTKIEKKYNLKGKLFVKLEYLNPAGSVKDRIAKGMVEDAEKKGKIKPGDTLVEPTSGNTGIGLAFVAAARGYHLILTMPETMSVERRNILKAYGAELVLTDGTKGMSGAIAKAKEIAEEKGAVILGQFDNPANPQTHYETTGPEIYEALDGQVGYFLAGVGTGGTLTGTGRYLKEKNPETKVIAIEPATSPVLSEGHGGPHKIQGIGAGFVPKVLDEKVYDEVITVDNVKPFETAKELAHLEGVTVGISSGAALYAGIQVASREEAAGRNVVVLLPDSGDRYYSTPLYQE